MNAMNCEANDEWDVLVYFACSALLSLGCRTSCLPAAHYLFTDEQLNVASIRYFRVSDADGGGDGDEFGNAAFNRISFCFPCFGVFNVCIRAYACK